MTPDAFVWWLRGYLEATGSAPGVQGALADVATIRDMLAHVPYEAAPPPRPISSPCGCGGVR